MNLPAKEFPHEKPEWIGYDLDQIRYMRAYSAARLEINRERLKRNFATAKEGSFVGRTGLVGKVLGTLNYLDIAFITISIGSKIFKAMRFFRKKR